MVTIGLIAVLVIGLGLAFRDGWRYVGIALLAGCAAVCLVIMVGHVGL